MKGIQIKKEEVISLFSDMIIYAENLMESTKKLLKLINKFDGFSG